MATPNNRDFLLLLPASLDPGGIDHSQVLAASAELGTYGHPLVLAVLPDTEEGRPVQTTDGSAERTIRVAIENHRLLLVLP